MFGLQMLAVPSRYPRALTILEAVMSVKLGWPCWIGVVVDDLQGQRRFYRDVLGFVERDTGVDWVHFELGNGNLLELVRRSNRPEYERRRYQVGYVVADILAARRELMARGVEPISEVEGKQEGRRWCYFRDPEGNVFEIKENRTA
jgi:catechol 2,3-dioxygenase-like lactoylglutathione lyase family enzyme